MPRERRKIPPPSSEPLVILAGFPSPTAAIERVVENFRPRARRAVSVPSGFDDRRLYPEWLTLALMRRVCAFASRRLKNDREMVPTPSRILLLYVDSPDSEELLRAFDFCVFPIALRSDQRPHYKHWRFNPEKSRALVTRALDLADDATKDAWAIKLRVENAKATEPLMLPPANFVFEENRSIEELYRVTRQGRRAWNDPFLEIRQRDFIHAMLPDYHLGGGTKSFFEDSRTVVFPPAKNAEHHGETRYFQHEHPSLEECQSLLRQLYRFGGALRRGFHHDIQRENGAEFGERIFYCREKGWVRLAGAHANVYPDDFIRGRAG
jgi:hypothetical protein